MTSEEGQEPGAAEAGDGAEDEGGLPPAPLPEPSPEDLDTIRFFREHGGLLRVRLEGPGVTDNSMEVFSLANVYRQLDRVVRGLTASNAGLSVGLRGRIKRPTGAAPWRAAARVPGSYMLPFVLGEEQAHIDASGRMTSPTIEAVRDLAELLRADEPPAAVERLMARPDRIGRDYTHLLGLLADNELRSRWEARNEDPFDVQPTTAGALRTALDEEVPVATALDVVTGWLFRLDTRAGEVRVEADKGGTVVASYEAEQFPSLRDALRHRVRLELAVEELRYPYASDSHAARTSVARVAGVLD